MDDEDFNGIMEGLEQTLQHVRGNKVGKTVREASPLVEVGLIRSRTGLSQAAFAETYHLDKRAIEQWEQRRRVPDRAAQTLYTLIERDPDKIKEMLAE